MIDQDHPIYHLSKEEVLCHLLKKERGYYEAVKEITRQEAEKLESSQSIEEIKPLFKKKKILMTCIQEIEEALIPLKKYWHSKIDRNDTVSGQIKQELILLSMVLKEILQLDLLSQKALKNHLLAIKEKGEKTPSDTT